MRSALPKVMVVFLALIASATFSLRSEAASKRKGEFVAIGRVERMNTYGGRGKTFTFSQNENWVNEYVDWITEFAKKRTVIFVLESTNSIETTLKDTHRANFIDAVVYNLIRSGYWISARNPQKNRLKLVLLNETKQFDEEFFRRLMTEWNENGKKFWKSTRTSMRETKETNRVHFLRILDIFQRKLLPPGYLRLQWPSPSASHEAAAQQKG